MAEKMLNSPEQKHEAAQSTIAALEQHFQIRLTEDATNRVIGMALDNLKSSATPRELREAIMSHMLEVLAKNDPARATELRAKAQNIPETEKGGLYAIAGNEEANNAKAGSPKEAGAQTPAQTPMFLDPKHDQEIKRDLDKASRSEFGTPFDQCTPLQKAEILKTVLEAGGTLGLTYDRRMGQKPQTVEEFLGSKSGNCADFSRLLVAVAEEKDLPVQMVSITFQAQDGTREEEQHLAVFNMGDKIYYLDLSNRILRPYSGFASTQDLIKDPGFQRAVLDDYKRVMKDGKNYRIAEEPKLIATEGAYRATYQADLGLYHAQKHDWDVAIHDYEKALASGLKSYWIYAELSFSYLKKGDNENAIKYGEDALKLRETSSIYHVLGDAHLKLKTEDNLTVAIQLFDKGLKIQNLADMQLDLAVAHNNLGILLGESGQYTDAIDHFSKALQIFKGLYDNPSADCSFTPKQLGQNIVLTYRNLVVYTNNGGKRDEALQILDHAITDVEKMGLDPMKLKDLLKSFK